MSNTIDTTQFNDTLVVQCLKEKSSTSSNETAKSNPFGNISLN